MCGFWYGASWRWCIRNATDGSTDSAGLDCRGKEHPPSSGSAPPRGTKGGLGGGTQTFSSAPPEDRWFTSESSLEMLKNCKSLVPAAHLFLFVEVILLGWRLGKMPTYQLLSRCFYGLCIAWQWFQSKLVCQPVSSGVHFSVAAGVCPWQRNPVGSWSVLVLVCEIHNLGRNPGYILKKSPLSRIMRRGEEERGDVIKPEDRKCAGHENNFSTST